MEYAHEHEEEPDEGIHGFKLLLLFSSAMFLG
jgi:hypothetical protein